MTGYLEIATFVLLLIFFFACEIYRLKAPMRGVISSITPIAGGLGGYQAKVKLPSGNEEEVYISSCVMCANKLTCGSEVLIHKIKNKKIASAPLVCKLKD